MTTTSATFQGAVGENPLPTQHWTTYLTLEAAEKTAFFKFIRQVALVEGRVRDQPEKSDEDFARELISNRSMAEIIYSLARNKAENPHDYTKDLPLDRALGAGIPIDICDPQDKMTALHITSYIDELDGKIAEILLDRGARIDAQDDRKRTPLFIAASFLKRVPLIKLLIEKGADINSQDKNGRTPLSEAARLQPSDVSFLETIGFLASHPKIDCTLPANAQRSIELLKSVIEQTMDQGKKLQLQAALSLIQEPFIAHLQQQNAALTQQLRSEKEKLPECTYALY